MVGRNTEIKELSQLYRQDGNQLVILYGRSNIGKSELVREFLQGKKYMYYAARQAAPELQRRMLGEEIEQKYQVKVQEYTYTNFFNRIRSGDGSKLVLVIDDFEYIAKKDPEFAQGIGRLRDKKLYPGPVLILLCSSSISWVEREMADALGTCAKKIAKQIKVEELGFVNLVHMLGDYSVQECVQVYGILGGVWGYLKRWDTSLSLKQNICRHILSPDGFLHREAQQYIKEELRELAVYNTILNAIAAGHHKLNDLFLYTGFSRAKISVYLRNLMAFEVVEKVASFETGGWDNAQKGLYTIRNTYLHFWYKFVYPHLSDLRLLPPEAFFDRYVAPKLEEHLNGCFRKVCMEYLQLMSVVRQLPIEIHKIGTWVGKQGSIDIIAQDSVREKIVGLCNWSEEFLTEAMFEQLLASMEQAKIKARKYYLFSARKFDEAVIRRAEGDERMVLIDMTRL